MEKEKNNLKAFLIGGEGAPEYAPEGLLASKGLSVELLARAVRVTRTAVYNYISGKNRPRVEVMRRMSEVLEVPFEEMLTYCTPVASGGRPPANR